MSGSNYGNKHIPSNQLDLAKKLAKLLNCPHDTSANVVKCLKSKTSKELTDFIEEFKARNVKTKLPLEIRLEFILNDEFLVKIKKMH